MKLTAIIAAITATAVAAPTYPVQADGDSFVAGGFAIEGRNNTSSLQDWNLECPHNGGRSPAPSPEIQTFYSSEHGNSKSIYLNSLQGTCLVSVACKNEAGDMKVNNIAGLDKARKVGTFNPCAQFDRYEVNHVLVRCDC